MGIPGLFADIIKNKFYKNIHSGVKNGKVNCEYFFMDYNGIVYSAYERIKEKIEGAENTKEKIEELLIEEVLRYTKYLICDIIKPSKLTYISLDGPAPRAKMVQQRSRRYKGYKDKLFNQEMKRKHNISADKYEWDRSANISPGTEFMEKLSSRLVSAMKTKFFSAHNPKMEFILSNSNVPGEGEHKFLNTIRSMTKLKSKENSPVYIYGKDADLIVLAISTHKNNLHIIREVGSESDEMLKTMYQDYEFLNLDIDNLRSGFNKELTRTFPRDTKFDETRILNDYIFLTFLVGNDFVMSMPFLKVRKGGLKSLIAIYHNIRNNHADYLVLPGETLNIPFLTELFGEISKTEDTLMKAQYKEVNKYLNGFKDNYETDAEAKLTPYQITTTRYVHGKVCSQDHPLFQTYHNDFKAIDYNKDVGEWKKEYYNYYLGGQELIPALCQNYFESLVYTLKYYFTECPSWTWHYHFRVSPLPSDLYEMLKSKRIDINKIELEKGSPYSPFEQLMLILPPQMATLLPKVIQPIMTDEKHLCIQYYPVDFRIDASVGIKTQYSEAILPEIEDDVLLPVIRRLSEGLSEKEMERNKISTALIMVK
jgi:5'-3' exonuclease